MFRVKDRETGVEFTVYAVAGTLFLVFVGHWEWLDAQQFEPIEE